MGSFTENITIEDHGTLGFKIVVTPTGEAQSRSGFDSNITNDTWSAIQSCVPGLYGSLADSIYQQLDCHVFFGGAKFASGPTWDLESWHQELDNPNPATYGSSHCLNKQPTILRNDLINLA